MCFRAWSLVFATALLAGFGMVDAVLAQETIKPFQRRVVGGEPTDIKQHPWQVALQFKGTFSCGGSIIAEEWILTAAHCFSFSRKSDDWRSKAGATDYTAGGAWSEIERVVVHEAYNPTTYENDIALLKLRSPPTGRVIPLAAPSLTLPLDQPLEVTGWGDTAENARTGSNMLRKGTVPYVSTDVCNEPAAYGGRIKAGMLCAGYKEGGVDSCQGDSGGPLVWNTPDGPVLVGVVSNGEGCARKLKYGIYTRVSSYRDWINRAMAQGGN